jgi:hypothetical protein
MTPEELAVNDKGLVSFYFIPVFITFQTLIFTIEKIL